MIATETALKILVTEAEKVTATYNGEQVQIHHVFVDGRLMVRSIEEHRESLEFVVDASDLDDIQVQA